MNTITIDTNLYTRSAPRGVGYTLTGSFLFNESPEEFVRVSRSDPATANLRGSALAEVEAPEFLDLVRAYISEGSVWTSKVLILGDVTAFTLRDVITDIVRQGEAALAVQRTRAIIDSYDNAQAKAFSLAEEQYPYLPGETLTEENKAVGYRQESVVIDLMREWGYSFGWDNEQGVRVYTTPCGRVVAQFGSRKWTEQYKD